MAHPQDQAPEARNSGADNPGNDALLVQRGRGFELIERALATADSIDEAADIRVDAFSQVAVVCAQAGVDYEDSLDLARTAAVAIWDTDRRIVALAAVGEAEGVIGLDPTGTFAAATEVIDSISPSPYPDTHREVLANAQARAGQDDAAVATIAAMSERGWQGDGVFEPVCECRLRACQFAKARATAEAVQDDSFRARMLRRVAVALAAAGMSSSAVETSSVIAELSVRAEALAEIAAEEVRAGRPPYLILDAAREVARRILHPRDRVPAFAKIAEATALAGRDPREDLAVALAAALAIGNIRERACGLVAVALAEAKVGSDPVETIARIYEEVAAVADPEDRAIALCCASYKLADGDQVDAARETLARIEDPSCTHAPLSSIAEAEARAGAIDTARRTAALIGDDHFRAIAKREIAVAEAKAAAACLGAAVGAKALLPDASSLSPSAWRALLLGIGTLDLTQVAAVSAIRAQVRRHHSDLAALERGATLVRRRGDRGDHVARVLGEALPTVKNLLVERPAVKQLLSLTLLSRDPRGVGFVIDLARRVGPESPLIGCAVQVLARSRTRDGRDAVLDLVASERFPSRLAWYSLNALAASGALDPGLADFLRDHAREERLWPTLVYLWRQHRVPPHPQALALARDRGWEQTKLDEDVEDIRLAKWPTQPKEEARRRKETLEALSMELGALEDALPQRLAEEQLGGPSAWVPAAVELLRKALCRMDWVTWAVIPMQGRTMRLESLIRVHERNSSGPEWTFSREIGKGGTARASGPLSMRGLIDAIEKSRSKTGGSQGEVAFNWKASLSRPDTMQQLGGPPSEAVTEVRAAIDRVATWATGRSGAIEMLLADLAAGLTDWERDIGQRLSNQWAALQREVSIAQASSYPPTFRVEFEVVGLPGLVAEGQATWDPVRMCYRLTTIPVEHQFLVSRVEEGLSSGSCQGEVVFVWEAGLSFTPL